jgi:hypothetical protein
MAYAAPGPKTETHYVVAIDVKRVTKTFPAQGSAATPTRDVVDELHLTRRADELFGALDWAAKTLTAERNAMPQDTAEATPDPVALNKAWAEARAIIGATANGASSERLDVLAGDLVYRLMGERPAGR